MSLSLFLGWKSGNQTSRQQTTISGLMNQLGSWSQPIEIYGWFPKIGAVAVRFRDAIYPYRKPLRFGADSQLDFPIAEEKHTQSPNEVTQQEEKDQSLLLRETEKLKETIPSKLYR